MQPETASYVRAISMRGTRRATRKYLGRRHRALGELEEPRVLSSQELQDMFPGSLLAERLQEQAAVKGRPD